MGDDFLNEVITDQNEYASKASAAVKASEDASKKRAEAGKGVSSRGKVTQVAAVEEDFSAAELLFDD